MGWLVMGNGRFLQFYNLQDMYDQRKKYNIPKMPEWLYEIVVHLMRCFQYQYYCAKFRLETSAELSACYAILKNRYMDYENVAKAYLKQVYNKCRGN